MNLKFIVFFLLTHLVLYLNAQDEIDSESTTPNLSTDPLFEVSVPDPQVASLGRFIESPISLFYGSPSISVPIYEIKLKTISIPISLSYNSKGVKVDELASDVGLGWTLNAGGVISHTIHGKSDVQSYLAYPDVLSDFNIPLNDIGDPDYAYAKAVAEGDFDTEPDLFFYSYPGNSGKFIEAYDEDGVYVPLPLAPVEINRFDNNVFKIIDENGIIYIFDEVSNTISDRHSTRKSKDVFDESNENRSWHLGEIITPSGEVVQFNYEYYDYHYEPSIYEEHYVNYGENLCDYIDYDEGYTRSEVRSPRITSIVTTSLGGKEGVKVEFHYDDEFRKDIGSRNTDINEARALKQIAVSHKDHTVKVFDLVHSYFGCDEEDEYSYSNSLKCRLKLDAVVENGINAAQFSYYDDMDLPPRLSKAQDLEGYFNNQYDNYTLIPDGTLSESEIDLLPYLSSLGNRDTNPNVINAFMLKEYHYPTGGYTRFNYEAKGHTEEEVIVTETETTIILYDHHSNPPNTQGELSMNLPSGYESLNFSVQFYLVDEAISDGEYEAPLTQLTLLEPDGSILTNRTAEDGGTYLEGLSPGEYKLRVFEPYEDIWKITWNVSATVISTSSYTTEKFVSHGGVRVKTITQHDSDGKKQLESTYEYQEPTSKYLNSFERLFINDDESYNACTYKQVSASSIPTTHGLQYDPEVGYGRVIKTDVSSEFENLVTEYQYYRLISEISDRTRWGQSVGYDWARGLPKSTIYKRKNGNGYETAREEFFEYTISDETTPYYAFYDSPSSLSINEHHKPGYRVVMTRPEKPADASFGIIPAEFTTEEFKIVSLWYYLSGKTTRNYEDGQMFETVESYEYDPTYKQLSKAYSTNSKGETVMTQYKRPYEYFVEPYMQMTKNHIYSPVVEQITKNVSLGQILSSNYIEYEEQNFFALPKSQYYLTIDPESGLDDQADNQYPHTPKWSGDFVLDRSYEYDDFDQLASVVSYEKTSNVIWGYDNNHIIAAVENPDQGDIAYTSFEENSDFINTGWYIPTACSEINKDCFDTNDILTILGCQLDYLECDDSIDGLTNTSSKTGISSYSGEVSKTITKKGIYQVSLWAKGNVGISVNGIVKNTDTPDDWGLLIWELDLNTGDEVVINTGTSLVDELRLHLVSAQMISYTWSLGEGVTTKSDANHLITYYEYDDTGRLSTIKDPDGNYLNEYEYIYGTN